MREPEDDLDMIQATIMIPPDEDGQFPIPLFINGRGVWRFSRAVGALVKIPFKEEPRGRTQLDS